jgi:hypothetical protein
VVYEKSEDGALSLVLPKKTTLAGRLHLAPSEADADAQGKKVLSKEDAEFVDVIRQVRGHIYVDVYVYV